MATVRYIVNDVDTSLAFYREHLAFREVMHPAPQFALLVRGDLRLAIVSPVDAGHPGGGSRPMPDGTRQEPGGGTGLPWKLTTSTAWWTGSPRRA